MSDKTRQPIRLRTPDGAAVKFDITVDAQAGVLLTVAADDQAARAYAMPDRTQDSFLDAFERLAADFGLRRPLSREAPGRDVSHPAVTPVLTQPLSPQIAYGYGDPCVVRVGESDYRLLVTSNDAPDAFPILASDDLASWRHSGFVFPGGQAPAWCLTGPDTSDFWAPELHRVGEEWWVCFTARERDGALAIGLAKAASPDGPFLANDKPLVRGGVIHSHILTDADGAPWLVWKDDDNDVWPAKLSAMLHARPGLISMLFDAEEDRRTASLIATLYPWIETLAPMEQFFAQQPLIEAVAEDLAGFSSRLANSATAPRVEVEAILHALRTRIYIQRLSEDGGSLLGEATVILQNDQPWEGHLIEGVWITREGGRYYLLYAGNDFSTARYGIGVAVADAPQGPYQKRSETLLSSGRDWWGPGHPSVAVTDDGDRRIFLHAFRPGEAGYKRFRALLTARITFADGQTLLSPL